MSIGNKIRDLRKINKITQEELGVFLGVTRSTIANYENGKRQVDLKTSQKIADFFSVTIDYLMGNDESTTKDFMYNAKTYFLSEEITQDEKDRVVKQVMDYYFKSKEKKRHDKRKGEKDSGDSQDE